MRAEIVITTEGRAILEVATKIHLPPGSEVRLLINTLWAIAKYDEYLEYVEPLILEKLIRRGWAMEATALAEAETIVIEKRLGRRFRRPSIFDEEGEEWP